MATPLYHRDPGLQEPFLFASIHWTISRALNRLPMLNRKIK